MALKKIYILNDLYVDEEHRRQGVAQSIMSEVTNYCKSLGAARLGLCTAINNLGAKALYESAGWEMNETYDYYSLQL